MTADIDQLVRLFENYEGTKKERNEIMTLVKNSYYKGLYDESLKAKAMIIAIQYGAPDIFRMIGELELSKSDKQYVWEWSLTHGRNILPVLAKEIVEQNKDKLNQFAVGRLPLHLAVINYVRGTFPEAMLSAMLENGADPELHAADVVDPNSRMPIAEHLSPSELLAEYSKEIPYYCLSWIPEDECRENCRKMREIFDKVIAAKPENAAKPGKWTAALKAPGKNLPGVGGF